MSPLEIVLTLMVLAVGLTLLANRLGVPYPIILVLGGLGLGLVPGLPRIRLEPDIVFSLFLPPLLFAAAVTMPWAEFRSASRSILQLGIGLVVVTAVAVAGVLHWAVGMPVAVGLLLGAIIAPSDSVAATAIAQRLQLPHRIVTILEGESLINDAVALVLFNLALAAVTTGQIRFHQFALDQIGLDLLRLSTGGILLGLAIGWGTVRVHLRMCDSGMVTLTSFVTPFAAYLTAEHLHVSGVLATVAAGLYCGAHLHRGYRPVTRIQLKHVWTTMVFLLNGLVFVLIGLQLPQILAEIEGMPAREWLVPALLTPVVVILVRLVWVFPTAYLPRLIFPRVRREDPMPPASWLVVIGWSGMRGIVSLAAALALPETLPDGSVMPARALLLFLTFVVILATLVLQGLTLPPLIRWLGLRADGESHEIIEARRLTYEAALTRFDAMEQTGELSPQAVSHVRERYRYILRVLDDGDTEVGDLTDQMRLEGQILSAERRVLDEMSRFHAIPASIYRHLAHDLDLREARLDAVRD